MAVKVTLFLIGLISRFFRTIGGRACRFEPSCSAYAKEALEIYRYDKALWMIVKRILRCHPFSAGGYDPARSLNKEVV